MPMTASQLRQNIYRALDQVLETGIPLEIERKGRILRILPVEPPSKLDNLKPREGFFRCDPDELVEMDWSGEWKP